MTPVIATLSSSSRRTSVRPWWPLPISALGSDGEIEPCWPSRRKQGSATARSPVSGRRTSRWGPARTSDAWARVGSDAAHHYDQTSSPYSAVGYQHNVENPLIPCSRAHAVNVSALMRSNGLSPDMSPRPRARVRRWPRST